jgi:hypothetical protein
MTEHDDALPDLDLGVLADGIDPSAGQWDAISAIAAHRRRRRSVVLSAAAVLILIAGTATVLLSRTADEPAHLSTGGTSGARYVIPPHGVSLASSSLYKRSDGFVIHYDDGLWAWTLESHPMTTVEPFVDSTEVPRDDAPLDQATIETEQFGAVRLLCRAVEVGEYGYTAERALTLLLGAEWQFEGHLVILRADLSARQGPSEDCSDSLEAPTLAAQIDRLRVVSEGELHRYLGIDDAEIASPSTSTPPELQPPSTTTTTVPEGDPAELGDARAQIELAVKGFDQAADDGTWPYLEDGVARADEYRQRQTAAEEQAGMTAVDDPDKVHEVVSITFESDEAAMVQYDITVTLPGGRVTVPHRHRFILQDGLWKMSYDSYLQLSGLACTSPGGYGESCQTGSYDTFGKTGG